MKGRSSTSQSPARTCTKESYPERVVEGSGREEDPLATVFRRIGGELPFGQLEDAVALILETHFLLDLPEDSDSIVPQNEGGIRGGHGEADADGISQTVVDGVVQDFGEAVLRYPSDVVGVSFKEWGNLLSPDDILLETFQAEVHPLIDRLDEDVTSRSCLSLCGEDIRIHQLSDPPMDTLAGVVESLSREGNDIRRMLSNMPNDELVDFIVNLHG